MKSHWSHIARCATTLTNCCMQSTGTWLSTQQQQPRYTHPHTFADTPLCHQLTLRIGLCTSILLHTSWPTIVSQQCKQARNHTVNEAATAAGRNSRRIPGSNKTRQSPPQQPESAAPATLRVTNGCPHVPTSPPNAQRAPPTTSLRYPPSSTPRSPLPSPLPRSRRRCEHHRTAQPAPPLPHSAHQTSQQRPTPSADHVAETQASAPAPLRNGSAACRGAELALAGCRGAAARTTVSHLHHTPNGSDCEGIVQDRSNLTVLTRC